MAKKNKTIFDTRINGLVFFTAAFTFMVIGLGFIIFFVIYASRQNKDNIEYFQSSIATSFGENVQFLEDGITSIRHSSELKLFLESENNNTEYAETALIYCIDIFSERNRGNASEPFVSKVYLFNDEDRFISIEYYPETVANRGRFNELFKSTVNEFKLSNENYNLFEGENNKSKILAIKLYNDEMKYMGICAMELNTYPIESMFEPVNAYSKSVWEVGLIPFSSKDSVLLAESDNYSEISETIENNDLYLRTNYSFGLYSYICIGRENIFYNMRFFAFILLIISIPLLFMMAIRLVSLIRENYEGQLAATKTQVKYLQSQLNPHFQYNVMAMLSIRAKKSGNEKLYKSLHAFSNLARGKIFKEGEIFITLHEEMELAEFYLLLQKDRFGDRLNYNIEYDKEKIGDILIPKLIIEPLVENSVEHGIEPKGEPGTVNICAKVNGEMLEISICDDGVGFNSTLTQTQTGTSFENTKVLLSVLYPHNHSMEIKTANNKGTKIKIIIPVKND